MKFIKFLGNSNIRNNELGGKGLSLNEMMSFEISIPPTFIITKQAFSFFCVENDLEEKISRELKKIKKDDFNGVKKISQRICKFILEAKIPKQIVSEIEASFPALDAKLFAIRSSATVEDSSSHSWAGQFESYLNVDNLSILDSVKKCWASLYNFRTIMYRIENNIFEDDISIAVIVQKMIKSEKSGVAFSINPVNGDENEIIIEAGFGLGDSVVSGETTPDYYEVSKKDFTINKKEKKSAKLCSKNDKNVLSKEELTTLSDLIVRIERHFGEARDIEWAKEGDKFFILQSRPVTTKARKKDGQNKKTTNCNDEYISVFESEGFSIFGAFLNYIAGYIEFGGVISCENSDKVSLFIPKDRLPFYEEEGLRIYESQNKVDEIINETNLLLKTFFDKGILKKVESLYIMNNETLLEMFSEFTDVSTELISLYKYTEEHYLYGVERKIEMSICGGSQKNGRLLFDAIFNEGVELKSKTARNLARNAKKMADFKLKTKKTFGEIFVGFDNLNKEIARRCKLSKSDDLEILFPKEIKGLLVGSISYSEFKLLQEKRKDNFLILKNRERARKFFGDPAKKMLYSIKHGCLNNVLNENVMNGRVANAGFAVGKAVIVPYVTDINDQKLEKIISKFNNGDIIVSKNTTPEVIVLVKKAGAIITEEGGITCHGAIVSREFKKPCIVGIKGISNLIKTGDIIEVDANNGMVRILNKKNEHEGA